MVKRNIIFWGFMGSGKSLFSNRLAQFLRWDCISTDKLIEKKEGMSIKDIFSKKGEAYFRQVEKAIVKIAAGSQGVVIDCGGGVVLDPLNIEVLKKSGTVVYLKSSPEAIFERIKHMGNRPLLNTGDPLKTIKELLRGRRALYEQADVIIETDGKSHDEIFESILRSIKHE